MDDALATVGYWIGLVKAAGLSVAEVRRDCEQRAAAGTVEYEDDFRVALEAVSDALGGLQATLEAQAAELEAELED